MDEVTKSLKILGRYRHILPKQTIKTIRGQILSGNIEEARKGLMRALRNQSINH